MQRKRSRSIPVIVAAAMLLTQGCTVGPKYKQPVVPVPDTWRMPVSESESLSNEKWWELLKDPVLQQLIRAALEHNTDIRLAASQVVQAQAQVMVTRSAQFPQVFVHPDLQLVRSAGECLLRGGFLGPLPSSHRRSER
jgi:multidrug efflux system outer membrane protein